MLTAIRRLGNSQGILIPKPLRTAVGTRGSGGVERGGRCAGSATTPKPLCAPAGRRPQSRWPLPGTMLSVMPEFGNEADEELAW